MKPVFKTVILLSMSVSTRADAVVNMWSGGFSQTFTDLELPPSRLAMKRTYDSRSLATGIFGFGWCTDYEAALSPLPDGGWRLRGCDETMEFQPSATASANLWIAQPSQTLLTKKDGTFQLTNQRGVTLTFDSDGTLRWMRHPGGELVTLTRSRDGRLERLTSSKGASIKLVYDPATLRVARVEAEGGRKVLYRYKEGNLAEAADEAAFLFSYGYDAFQNLTRINYPDSTYQTLSYDDRLDRVTRIRNREACVETYTYQTEEPTRFTSTAQKSCAGAVVASSKHEFWHRTDDEGRVYLARARVTQGQRTLNASYEPRQKRSTASTQAPRVERRH